MKFLYLVIGIGLGCLATYLLLTTYTSQKAVRSFQSVPGKAEESNWDWPDSLDALVAAPANHQLIFENEQFRVLRVTVIPGILDPIHTHKGKSIIWVTKSSPLHYHVYDYEAQNKWRLIRTDTINVKPDELFKSAWEKPEQPHSVENVGKDTFELYRIEYKNSD